MLEFKDDNNEVHRLYCSMHALSKIFEKQADGERDWFKMLRASGEYTPPTNFGHDDTNAVDSFLEKQWKLFFGGKINYSKGVGVEFAAWALDHGLTDLDKLRYVGNRFCMNFESCLTLYTMMLAYRTFCRYHAAAGGHDQLVGNVLQLLSSPVIRGCIRGRAFGWMHIGQPWRACIKCKYVSVCDLWMYYCRYITWVSSVAEGGPVEVTDLTVLFFTDHPNAEAKADIEETIAKYRQKRKDKIDSLDR